MNSYYVRVKYKFNNRFNGGNETEDRLEHFFVRHATAGDALEHVQSIFEPRGKDTVGVGVEVPYSGHEHEYDVKKAVETPPVTPSMPVAEGFELYQIG